MIDYITMDYNTEEKVPNSIELDGMQMSLDEALRYLVEDGMTSAQAMNYICKGGVY